MSMTLDTLALPDQLVWVDEYGWSDVKASKDYTLQGKLIVEQSVVSGSKGRPITLQSENAWMTRSDLNTLYAWAQEAGKEMTLTLHDSTLYNVCFRHWDAPVIEAENITGTPHRDADIEYILTLKLAIV
jgi:hypothetical protein